MDWYPVEVQVPGMDGSPYCANTGVQSDVHGEAVPVRIKLVCSSRAQAAAPAGVAGLGTNEVPENLPFALSEAGLMFVKAIVPWSVALPATRSSLWRISRLNEPETALVPSVP